MASIFLWVGLTMIVALPVLGIAAPLLSQAGAILMIVGCILLAVYSPRPPVL